MTEPSPELDDATPMRGWSGPRAVTVATVLAVARFVVPIAALPLLVQAAADPNANMPLLILLRPGRPELLLAGFRISDGHAQLAAVLVAFIPLGVLSTWGFFWLGRLLGPKLSSTEGGGWLARAVPPATFAKVQRLLERRGPALAIFGRVAGLPNTLLAAAAATSKISARRYLAADLVGAAINLAVILAVGAALGETYERAGKWFTIGGVVLIFAMSSLVSNWFQREMGDDEAPTEPTEPTD